MLRKDIVEFHAWITPGGPNVHLVTNSSLTPAHLGAAIIVDGACFFTHYSVPLCMMDQFKRCEGNQIMGLELLSISLGLGTFQELLRGGMVIIHSDNSGAEVCCPHRLRPCRITHLGCRWPSAVA